MMFADDRSIENLQQLFVEFKKYLKLQKEYTKLEITEKLSILLSALVLLSVVIILGMVALFYLSFALAYILDPLVGGLMVSFSIIAAFHLLLVLLVITFRKKLIINPMDCSLRMIMKNDIIMNNMPDSSSMTLESIALRKKELRKKLHVQKEIMTDTARELFAPLAPAADKGNAIMRAFNTGMAVFDGLMLGVKMMRKVRSMFGARR